MSQQILMITANRLGDAVLSTGLVQYLHNQYPAASLTIACGPQVTEIFSGFSRVHKIIPLAKQPRYGHWRRLWAECHKTEWELVVDLRNSLASRFLRTKRRAARTSNDQQHKVRQNAAILGLREPPAPTIPLTPAAQASAAAAMAPVPWIALGPAANWPAKQWPMEHWQMLLAQLQQPGQLWEKTHFLLVASAAERPQLEPLLASLPAARTRVLLGAGLQEVAASLAQCRLFIGNDSGLMHMAAALGALTLGLFGPSPDWQYAPWGPHSRVLHTPETREELLARLPYAGAFYPNLMAGLHPAQVAAAIMATMPAIRGS